MRCLARTMLVGCAVIVVGLSAGLAQDKPGKQPQQRQGREGRGRGMRNMRMPDDMREFIEQFAPGGLEKLQALRFTDMDRYRQTIRKLMRQKRELDQLKETDPEAYEQRRLAAQLQCESRKLADQIRGTDDPNAKKEAKAKLAEIVSQLFDIQCEQLQNEIDEMAKRLEEMKATMEKRKGAKEKIVERRVNDLAGENDYLRWDIGRGQQGRERRGQR